MMKSKFDSLSPKKGSYRLSLADSQTYQIRFQRTISFQQIVWLAILTVALLAILIFMLIAYTPLRFWIPGYADPEATARQKKILAQLTELEAQIAKRDSFLQQINHLPKVLEENNVVITSTYTDNKTNRIGKKATAAPKLPELAAIESTGIFTNSAANNKTEIITYKKEESKGLITSGLTLISPINGYPTATFTPAHPALDLAAPAGSNILSVADGYVFMADYTIKTGYVIGIWHEGGIMSFYKHNSRLLKQVGEYVRAGESIAIIGNSGELSTGTHLHFELWIYGRPVNPAVYLSLNTK